MLKIKLKPCDCPDKMMESILSDASLEQSSREFLKDILRDENLSYKTKLAWAREIMKLNVLSREQISAMIKTIKGTN